MLINKCDTNTKMYIRWMLVVVLINGSLGPVIGGNAKREEIPLVRLPSNTLLKYTAYKDVSILHFDVPADTRTAYFNFKAYEETKSAFQRQCKPRDVTLHLKAGSYPVISPENITFPKHLLHADQRFEVYNLQFKSDGTMQKLIIDGPNIGDWFAVAFISWTDPNNDRIEQQGYRGWDCTEDSEVPSSFSILMALLLLTLSNLLFIPSIYIAVRRKYFTEGIIIYFFAMFFSIFYHACDSGEDEYSFCLVKIGVLQFCDFYCGLLAIWVTLIAMAHIRQTFVSMLHMFGAIVLAFGTELNKQSLWVFLAPALTGLCLISVSWGWRCKCTRKWFPARKYLSIFLPIGMVLVMCGLICYAFLQTRHNYFVVHSVWHMVMALSILCLLPSRNSFLPKC